MDFGMSFPVVFMISHCYLFFPLALFLPAVFYYFGLSKKGFSFTPTRNIQAARPRDVKRLRPRSTASKPTRWYQDLFFQLQHLEDHPTVLEPARDELLAMFSWAVSLALEQPQGSILAIEHYDAKKVWSFIEAEHERVLTQWGSYLERRKQGQGPELFATTEAAKAWLVQHAPVKFVDGAWLAHTHKITTPFALRSVTKNAWQVLSEELGDGDLLKHHVHLYRQLLEDVGCPLPDAHSADFIKPCHWDRAGNGDSWKAAVGQLLISLFPHEFLPEILGFNMHYELITLDTMQAAHELKGLGINPYYFLLHISIDNADSGHTAMAAHTVTRYLDMVRATEGEAALEQAWKRVQVGYTLSQALGGSFSPPRESFDPGAPIPNVPLDPLSARVIDIFKAKASVSHQFHCQSRARIGGRTLAEWLAPSMWAHPHTHSRQQLDLLMALSQAKPWVQAGASGKSLLVRELSWEGRMFGAFTHDEVVALTAWIDSLGPDNKNNNAWLYWSFTRRERLASKDAVGALRDPARHHPAIISTTESPESVLESDSGSDAELQIEQQKQPLGPPSEARLPDVVALWFAHIGLLENTINTPSRTASPLYASILRVLRAQAGFTVEGPVVAGMDEMKRPSCHSLVDIGLELVSRAKWGATTGADFKPPSCLHDVFLLTASRGQGEESVELARDMLRWAARPVAKLGLLLGLALAFLELKDAVAKAPGLLGQDSRLGLEAIVVRERQSLEECAWELRSVDKTQYKQLVQGYRLGRCALERCL